MNLKRKHQLSEDNPFRETPSKMQQIGSMGSDTLFISKSNISKLTLQKISGGNSGNTSEGSSRIVIRRMREKSQFEQRVDEEDEDDEEEEFDTDDKILIASTDDDEAETKNTDFQDAKESTQSASEPVRLGDKENEDEEEEDEDDETPLEVLEEMNKLEECFPVLSTNYRLLDKIGEGTFSTVFRAEALNGSVKMGSELWKSPPLKKARSSSTLVQRKKNPIVALKQIYVTSSPNRIHNELNLLYMLSGNSHVAALLDVLRHQDQVVAILPYYKHADFRDFYRDLPIKGIKKYMWELFKALSFVHEKAIIHRDLKPTNFLYDPFKGRGVLVDFGLAEKQPPLSTSHSYNSCPCIAKDNSLRLKKRIFKAAYPKQDLRPPRRANRAGTRGFRAPEVLFKCTNQLTKLDVWSAGVIALSIILRKFPLFNSPDDVDAIMELVLIFGMEKMTKCAELHGCGLELQLTTQPERMGNGNLVQLMSDFLRHEAENESIPSDSVLWDTLELLSDRGDKFIKPLGEAALDNDELNRKIDNYKDHKYLVELLNACLHMDHRKRLTAKQALKFPFFSELANLDDDEIIL
ncbi:uncharacterized protein KQ657_004011 [Scheffersomyces spartinae]|uniref:non-specific serine/threonine protein kinase n=1 Tax=Scheffersomyces spartinae TaxID=45513 RepID=A0A9P7VBD6_9ASCO|nr:uncharacterized protein KQ657_004011 [Scheffersomyces spartinae]KAG7194903.1 hypothetical protein KQ657_004011 [Scheffersomyces spartinae]